MMNVPLPKCAHQGAHATPRCVKCGAITNSHKLANRVPLRDGTFYDQPVTALQQVQCPNCNNMVTVPHQAMMCHKCWVKAEAEKALDGRESGERGSAASPEPVGGTSVETRSPDAAVDPVKEP